ncbi:transposase family protein [Kitasatospora sp. NPDC001159]
MERLRLVPDPRRRRGVRHPFVAVLLVAASAVVAGARSYTAIGQWSANAPQHTLARLGARVTGAPSAATIRRVIGLVCPGGLADLTGADPAGSDSIAVDGKAARGSRHGTLPAAHLLAAMIMRPPPERRPRAVGGCQEARTRSRYGRQTGRMSTWLVRRLRRLHAYLHRSIDSKDESQRRRAWGLWGAGTVVAVGLSSRVASWLGHAVGLGDGWTFRLALFSALTAFIGAMVWLAAEPGPRDRKPLLLKTLGGLAALGIVVIISI